MQLEKPYLTTTRYSKKKKKTNNKNKQAQKDHDEWLKRMGVNVDKTPKKSKKSGIYEIPDYSTGPRMTSDRIAANGTAKKSNVYTGDEIMGIGTMHKSNAVPIRKDSKETAKDLASMRR